MATSAQQATYAAQKGLNWAAPGEAGFGTAGYIGQQDYDAYAAANPAAAGGTAGAPSAAAPSATAYNPNQTLQGQAGAASSYSAAPTANPTQYTANQGGQDVMRNALLAQMSQKEIPSVNDPQIKAQVEPFAAAVERARTEEVRRGAEESFGAGQSYGAPEKMAAAERAGQKTGLFASDLVGKELTARRSQISDSLNKFGGLLSQDQQAALQRELAALDAQLKREGLSATTSLGQQDIALRDKLGMGGLNVDMIRALLQNQQFGNDLGYRIGTTEAQLNNDALRSLM